MATLHTCTVGVGGGYNYASLSAAEAANFGAGGADLVALDKYVVVDCYPGTGPDTAACSVDGFTTDATRNITIQAAIGYRHSGVWSDNVYTMASQLNCLSVLVAYTKVFGIQFDVYAGRGGLGLSASYCTGRYLIARAKTNAAYGLTVAGATTVGSSYECCISYGFNSSTDSGGFSFYTPGGLNYGRNLTAYDCGKGYRVSSGAPLFTNCIAVNCTSVCFAAANASSSYNVSTDATAPGTNYTRNATVTFKDAAAKDLHIESGNAFSGIDLSAYFTTDIDEQTITTWSAGADAQAGSIPSGVTISMDIAWAMQMTQPGELAWATQNTETDDLAWAIQNTTAGKDVAWGIQKTQTADVAWGFVTPFTVTADVAWEIDSPIEPPQTPVPAGLERNKTALFSTTTRAEDGNVYNRRDN
jgi:hypothetical protein